MSDDCCGHHLCVGPLPAAHLSRRQVLSQFGLGLGGVALANLVNPAHVLAAGQQPSPTADRGVLGGRLHVPAKAKRVIYLFMAGGPSQLELFDYKPLLQERNGEELPDSRPQGPAAHRHVRQPGVAAARRLACSSSRSTASGGAWVSDLLPHTAKIVDDLCFVRSMFTEAINHDPAITFFQTGSADRRPAEPRRVAQLRPRQRQREPAGVRRADHAGTRSISRSTRGCGAAASCRSQHQGVQFRSGKEPGALPAESRRRHAREPARDARPARASCSSTQRSGTATRRSTARIAQYEMAFRMQTSVPEVMDLVEGAGDDASSSTARTRARPARSPPTACWPAGWPSAACGSSSSTTTAGTSTATCRAASAAQCQETDQRQRGARHGPEAARPARRHAGRLGRRVRPHELLAGQADRRQTTAATTTRAASRVWLAGGGVKPGIVHGATDDFGYNVVENAGPRPRPAGHDPAPARHRPRAAHLQVPPGPPLPPDRRARDGGEGPAQLSVCSRKPRSLSGLRTT